MPVRVSNLPNRFFHHGMPQRLGWLDAPAPRQVRILVRGVHLSSSAGAYDWAYKSHVSEDHFAGQVFLSSTIIALHFGARLLIRNLEARPGRKIA